MISLTLDSLPLVVWVQLLIVNHLKRTYSDEDGQVPDKELIHPDNRLVVQRLQHCAVLLDVREQVDLQSVKWQ